MTESPDVQDAFACYFWSGDAIRSRSLSDIVLTGRVDIAAPSESLNAGWERETSLRLGLEPGDVETLSLARARSGGRWPDYRRCVLAVSDWTRSVGLPGVLDGCDVALMTCRGAKYHHDAEHYGASAFCNLFLSEDRGLDLHFPLADRRIPLTRGTVVVFDTGQPHAVVKRGSGRFDAADFPAERDCTQIFLTWELPIQNIGLRRALQIACDIDPATALSLDQEQVWRNGARVDVCPQSGRWCCAQR